MLLLRARLTPIIYTQDARGTIAGITCTETQCRNECRVGGWPGSFWREAQRYQGWKRGHGLVTKPWSCIVVPLPPQRRAATALHGVCSGYVRKPVIAT